MYSERIERAIRLALSAHAGQIRKADPHVPYATHPLHVAIMVQEAGGGEDSIIGALLHDLLEDTDVTTEDLDEEFGRGVSTIVQEVSEDKSLTWRERKARMVERLRSASKEACMVAAADKIHNLETLVDAHQRFGPSVWHAFRGKPEETIRFNEEVFDAIRGRIPTEMEAAFTRALEAGRRLLSPAV
jgi:(p)ppGpp synthase/HD superfamily hydrolase